MVILPVSAAWLMACADIDRVGPPGWYSSDVTAMVALRDLPVGHTVTPHDLRAVEVAGSWLPEGVIGSPEDAVERYTLLPIHAGEWIVSRALSEPLDGVSLQAVIPPGMQVVGFDSPRGLPIKAGMYVDLWWAPSSEQACAVAQHVFVVAPHKRRPMSDQGEAFLLTTEQIPAVLRAMDHPSFRVIGRYDIDPSVEEEVKCSL